MVQADDEEILNVLQLLTDGTNSSEKDNTMSIFCKKPCRHNRNLTRSAVHMGEIIDNNYIQQYHSHIKTDILIRNSVKRKAKVVILYLLASVQVVCTQIFI